MTGRSDMPQWFKQKHKEKHRRELAYSIMESALKKVGQLGFVPTLRERDATDRHTGRHHIVLRRVEFTWVGEDG